MSKRTYYPPVKRFEKLGRDEQFDLLFDLINAFSVIKNPAESAFLLSDLLTAKEIKNLAKRLRIAKLSLDGNTQRDISKEVHCSFVTVTKVRMWLNEGGEGLKRVISRLPKRYNLPKNLPKIPIEFQLPNVIFALAQSSVSKKQSALIENFEKSVGAKGSLDSSLREIFKSSFTNRRKSR